MIVTGSLRAKRVWTCKTCGVRQYGESVTFEIQTAGSVDMVIERQWSWRPRTDFPAGWVNYWDGAVCERCPHV